MSYNGGEVLILTAQNRTPEGLERPDGTADYYVWLGINQHCIWNGPVLGHVRAKGAGALLRRVADIVEKENATKPTFR